MEVMVVLALLTALIAGAAGALYSSNLISRRLSDYTAAFAVVEAKLEDIRAGTYNPPNSPFGSTPVTLTSATIAPSFGLYRCVCGGRSEVGGHPRRDLQSAE